MKTYKILNINGITHNTYGKNLLVEAAPVETNSGLTSFSLTKTDNFIYPEEESYINYLTDIADNGFLEINFEDFQSENNKMNGEGVVFYRHKSFFSFFKRIKKITIVDSNIRKVGIISYEDKSSYYGNIKNSKRDGYGFMIDELNHSLTLARYDNDETKETYSDFLEEMINNTVKFTPMTFYPPNGVYIGDIICPDLSDSTNDIIRKRQLDLAGKDRYGIAILDNGCMYIGNFIAGSSMKLVDGYKVDEIGERHYGEIELPIDKDGGEYPWSIKRYD